MADYLNIAGRVRTTASDGVAMEAQEVKDLNLNKSQQEVNADVQTELGDRYTKEETYSKEQLDNLITTPDENYVSVVATNATTAVTDVLPATGEANTSYRVGNWNGTQYDPTMYALYAWNGSAYVCLAVRSFVGEVYDISVNHPDGQGNPTPYADLTAALGTNGANIPADIRRGGMSIKFIQGTVQSSDNKYVQYRLMADTFSTTESDWQGVDEEPTADSENLVKSGGVYNELNNRLLASIFKNTNFLNFSSGAYYAGTDIGSTMMPETITSTENYYCVKVTASAGSTIRVQAEGGHDYRTWYVFDSDKKLTRCSEALANTINSPVELTLVDDEKYVLVNTQTVSLQQSSVYFINIGKEIEQIYSIKDDVDKALEDISNLDSRVTSLEGELVEEESISRLSGPTQSSHIADDGTLVTNDGTNDKTSIYDIRDYKSISVFVDTTIGARRTYSISKDATFTNVSNIKSVGPMSAGFVTNTYNIELQEDWNYILVFDRAQNTTVTGTKNKIDVIQVEVQELKNNSIRNINIENIAVRGYNTIKYNNCDFSYTDVTRYASTARSGLTAQQLNLPSPIIIDTPLQEGISSRTLRICDSPYMYDEKHKDIQLDLVSETYTLYNLEPNKTYYYWVYYNSTVSWTINSGNFTTLGKTRMLAVEANTDYVSDGFIGNIRDLGGLKTDDNRSIRYGVLIRGSQLDNKVDNSYVDWVTQDGINTLENFIGISAHLDLRAPGSDSTGRTPLDVDYNNIYIDQWFFKLNIYWAQESLIAQVATAIRKIIEWLSAGKSIYFGCYGAADRTGDFSTIIEGLCGVTEDEICHDYEMTSFSGGLRNRDRNLFSFPSSENLYQGDFKFSMDFIKSLKVYNGDVYVSYDNNYYNMDDLGSSPVAVTDASLIASLDAVEPTTLKEKFITLMTYGSGGLTRQEIYKLQELLLA